MSSSSSSSGKYSLDAIKDATNDFDKSKVLGKGGEATVYRGNLYVQKTAVAIKHLETNSAEFETEIQSISNIQHPNLVSLLGHCDESDYKILIYEYMENGSLSNYVGDKSSKYLSWLQRLKICLDAARGLAYLHTETADHPKGIIHRDIKPDNILIDENWVGKISDFGMVKLSTKDQVKSTMFTDKKGTPGYFAPEYLSYQKVTRKIDVYCFGVVLFQLLSQKLPWDRGDESYIATNDEDLGHWAAQNIDKKIKSQISQDCLEVFTDIIKRSLRQNPIERPTMKEIVLDLEKALKLQEPEEECKQLQAAIFRPMDPRSYFEWVGEGSYYHVFVSYKMETRNEFAIPLHRALEHAGFRTFLEHTGKLGTVEYDAITNSMCAVVILSQHFTVSRWCLEELHCILERKKHYNFSLLPIYYKLDPADFRPLSSVQRGHLQSLRKDHGFKVNKWTAAIEEVAKYKPIVFTGDPRMFTETIVQLVREEFRRFPTEFETQ